MSFFMRRSSKTNGGSAPLARDDPQAREQLAVEEGRAFKTYRARESAARRLGRRARAWNAALVAFATSTTIAAVGMLTDPEMYGTNGDTLMVCLTILSLVASLTTANVDYSGRSRDMFINYRKLQRLAVEMEELRRQSDTPITRSLVQNLSERYQAVLDETENHTSGDHLRHFARHLPADHPHHSTEDKLFKSRRRAMVSDFLITSLPYVTLVVPVALVIPLMDSLVS